MQHYTRARAHERAPVIADFALYGLHYSTEKEWKHFQIHVLCENVFTMAQLMKKYSF